MNDNQKHEELDRDARIIQYSRILAQYRAFLKEVLGIERNDNYGYVDLCEAQEELVDYLQEPERCKMVLTPRYTFKSAIATVGESCWEIARNPNIRILIYSDTATKAQGFLQGIKNHILGTAPNTKFHKFFPGYYDKDKKWTETEIVIGGRTVDLIEPTVDTGGIETTKVGKHYDLIIFDDIVSDINTTTKAQMDKVYDCYKKSLSLLTPNGRVIIVGTRWAFGDAYGRIIKEDKDLKPFIKKAIVNSKYLYEKIGLTKEFLNKQLLAQGSYFFSCLYQNEPVSDEEAIFKYEKFSFYQNIDHNDLYVTASVDPAGDGEDYTAITVVGTDKENTIFVLDIVNKHLRPNQIIEEIIRLSYKWQFKKIGIETNFLENLERELIKAREEESANPMFTSFAIEAFRTKGNSGNGKFLRIISLQPWHERGALKFKGTSVETLPQEQYELAMQMIQFTNSHRPEYDDIVDALSFQLKLIRPSDKVVKEELPPNSFKRFYMKQFNKNLELNRSLPYRLRKRTLQESLFGG